MGKDEETLSLFAFPADPEVPKFRGQKKAETPKKRTLNLLDEAIRAAHQLSDEDLPRLQAAIAGLMEAREIEKFRGQEEVETPETRTLNQRSGQSGSFELKMINKCGPYKYLRYWSGGKHRSVYLGKAAKTTE